MGDMLSQAEIDALLNGTDIEEEDSAGIPEKKAAGVSLLTAEEKDALGEIGNISMGTSATTLYALLGQKVNITTPKVDETTWEAFSGMFVEPYVAVRVQYTEGLIGFNLLIMKESDVKIITDLMMGGDGYGNAQGELTELHLSAISEAMNQMVGSSATSLSSMFDKRVDISPPESTLVSDTYDSERIRLTKDSAMVLIRFSLKVGDLIDSEIMQVLPISFAKEMVTNLLKKNDLDKPANTGKPTVHPPSQPSQPAYQQPQVQVPQPGYQQNQAPYPPQQASFQMPNTQYQMPQQPANYAMNPYGNQPPQGYGAPPQQPMIPVNVQPAQFPSLDEGMAEFERKNISLLMDVPLQVSVELGRTTKRIREILEFGQGSIIELDKLAGEPVDILVNGKAIAKGEVVVIDESFGVRITDIIHPSKRL